MLRLVEAMPGMVWLGMAWQSGLGGVRRAWERLGKARQSWLGKLRFCVLRCGVLWQLELGTVW